MSLLSVAPPLHLPFISLTCGQGVPPSSVPPTHLRWKVTISHNTIISHSRRNLPNSSSLMASASDITPAVMNEDSATSPAEDKKLPPLESKLQEKMEQKMRMKLAKKIRLRRKRLVRKRRLRKKGRWPPSKMNKLKNV